MRVIVIITVKFILKYLDAIHMQPGGKKYAVTKLSYTNSHSINRSIGPTVLIPFH